MTRDTSLSHPLNLKGGGSERQISTLETLGWQTFFAQQTSVDELAQTPPVRIVEVHRKSVHVIGDDVDEIIPTQLDATVGDWLLLDSEHPQSSRVLDRKSLIQRRAPGKGREVQLIAANIDTAFVVTSCNQDFNVARLERYIALAFEAEVEPVIVLTKSDLATSAESYVEEAQAISELVRVVVLDARGDEPKMKLQEWCKLGKTVAFLGSSGVGKSTLVNALSGTQSIETKAIRENDAKGRHTTTSRQLHILPGRCVVLDTPGMRELQMTDAAAGIQDLFADLHALSTQCRFRDCLHVSEPGCAVLTALEKAEVDEARLERWRKLTAEDAFNSASLAQRKCKDKSLGKIIRQVKKQNKRTPQQR